MTETVSEEKKSFRIMDEDIPFLASEAAIDIDNILGKKDVDLKAMKKLGERLKNSIERDENGTNLKHLMDPATINVLNGAVAQTMSGEPKSRIDDLLNEASGIADILINEKPQDDIEGITKARNFCISLSKAIISFRGSLRDRGHSHPFRR